MTNLSSKTAVLIPVYNESAHLAEVIHAVRGMGFFVLVVDDGSTDASAATASEAGAQVLSHRPNRGKGYALRQGFKVLLDRGFEWVVIMDGDGQHRPEDIPQFTKKAESGVFGLINGSRMWDSHSMPWVRYATNKAMSSLISLWSGCKIDDCQCGFKMLSAEFLKRAHLISDNFEIEDELILEAARLKFPMVSVPVRCHYGQETSHIHPWRDTCRFFAFLWGYRFSRRHP